MNRERPAVSPSRTVPTFVHVEYGIAFGGSIVSLSELVGGLRARGLAKSVVITFLPAAVVDGLFRGTPLVRMRPLLSYRTRAVLVDAVERVPAWLRTLILKGYAALDLLHEHFLGWRIARVARRVSADAIHCNNDWMHSALLAAHRCRVPCVLHFRDFAPGNLRELLSSRRYASLTASIRRCIGISDAVSRSIVESGTPSDLVRTIHNPVSAACYEVGEDRAWEVRRRHALRDHDVVVGVFGRITPWKGQLEFLMAVEPLLQSHQALRIMIVGDQSDSARPAYGQRVAQFAAQAHLAGRIVLAGYQADVPAYYAACDVVVHCSLSSEPFGRVVIEGMAAGRAVIAMAEGGPLEIITDGHDGLLVPPRTPVALRDALAGLLDDPERRARIGSNARQTILERFSPSESADRFMAAVGVLRPVGVAPGPEHRLPAPTVHRA